MRNCKTFKELEVGDYIYDMVRPKNVIYKNKITRIENYEGLIKIFARDNKNNHLARTVYRNAINNDMYYDWDDIVSTSLERLFDEVIKNLNQDELFDDTPFR